MASYTSPVLAQKVPLKRLSPTTSSTVLVLTSISICLECLVGFYGGDMPNAITYGA